MELLGLKYGYFRRLLLKKDNDVKALEGLMGIGLGEDLTDWASIRACVLL